jgi:peptidoglycan hydrolase-like protein with peptidoglycan-binding domain
VVKAFQKWDCLTPDGIVGRNTWRELCFLAGQVNFIYAGQPAAKRNAWYAARRAGCAVEYP